MKKTYRSVELSQTDANIFRGILKVLGFKFETSACYNLIHFEILADDTETEKLNKILQTI